MTAYRDYDNSPLMQLLRFCTRSFAIGTFFGVHVRMYWAAAIIMPLLFWYWIGSAGTALETFVLTASCFFGLFTIIWSHEMGHIACGWRFRIRTDLITLSPLGGVAHMNAPASTPRAELLIALAGPAVHLIWLAAVWPLHLLLPDRVVSIDGWFFCPIQFTLGYLVNANVWLFLFNLMPFFPLDGGRTLRSLLAMRVHPNRATMWATTVGMIGGGVFIVLGLTRPKIENTILVVIGISCIQACLNERRTARHVLIYQQAMQDPWATDPDAWKRGEGPLAPKHRRNFFARWWRARAERKAQRAAAADAAFDREVDQVLERVHQVGMSGLTDREKAVLKRASQRRRGTG